MKIIMIECNAEELKANRTVMDSIISAIDSFSQNMFGIDGNTFVQAMATDTSEEDEQEQKE